MEPVGIRECGLTTHLTQPHWRGLRQAVPKSNPVSLVLQTLGQWVKGSQAHSLTQGTVRKRPAGCCNTQKKRR